MALLLNNASSGSAYIQVPSVSIGATVGDYIEIKANANAGNPSNNYRPFGDYTLGANANIVQMRPTYLQVIAGNTNMSFTTGYTQPAVGSDFVLRLVKASSTQWQAILNGVSLGLQSASTAFLLSAIFKMNTSTSEAFRGKVYYVEISTNGGTSPTRYYDPSASGGTGTTLHDTVGGQHGTQAGTWPSDDSEWVSYGSSEIPFSATINKSTLSTSNKQLSISSGVSLGINKQSLTLSPKTESVAAGAITTINKLGISVSTKQLSVVAGANIPYSGSINKSTVPINSKQLGFSGGFSSGINKQSLSISGKQETVSAGFNNNIPLLHLTLQQKLLAITVGTNIPFTGNISKVSLNLVGKPLSIVTGTNIPFIGSINKTSLTLTGKQLSVSLGTIVELQKRSLLLNTKLLSIGEILYPVVSGDRVYLLSLRDNIFSLTNRNNTINLSTRQTHFNIK